MTLEDDEWSSLSLLIANDPENFTNWENLIKYVSKGLNKLTPSPKLQLFRVSFNQFLTKFPLLEQYWINYAEIEFQLGNTETSKDIYEKALDFNAHSYLIWLKYLKLLREIELDYNKLMLWFNEAETKIGYHYHSYEFWNEFLETELKFNGKSTFYYNILRKVLEIPIYNYSVFFKIWFQEIDGLNSLNLLKLIKKDELAKKFKIDLDEIELKNINYVDLSLKFRKIFTDLYITTQFKSFEIYQYEKKIGLEFYVPGLYKSYQDLNNWLQYLEFVEINGSLTQVEQLYERSLIPNANYVEIWLKYSDYHIRLKNYQTAKTILNKSLLFIDDSKVLTKLVKIELALKNIIKAKDLLITGLAYNPDNIEYLLELINVEYSLDLPNPSKFKKFLINLVNLKPLDIAIVLLKHLANFKSLSIDLSVLEELNENGRFNELSDYWILYLNAKLTKTERSRQEILDSIKTAFKHIPNDKRLIQWYENYQSYDIDDDDELQLYFSLDKYITSTV